MPFAYYERVLSARDRATLPPQHTWTMLVPPASARAPRGSWRARPRACERGAPPDRGGVVRAGARPGQPARAAAGAGRSARRAPRRPTGASSTASTRARTDARRGSSSGCARPTTSGSWPFGPSCARCSTRSATTWTTSGSSSPTRSTPRASSGASRACSTSSCRSRSHPRAALQRARLGRRAANGAGARASPRRRSALGGSADTRRRSVSAGPVGSAQRVPDREARVIRRVAVREVGRRLVDVLREWLRERLSDEVPMARVRALVASGGVRVDGDVVRATRQAAAPRRARSRRSSIRKSSAPARCGSMTGSSDPPSASSFRTPTSWRSTRRPACRRTRRPTRRAPASSGTSSDSSSRVASRRSSRSTSGWTATRRVS